MRIVFSLAFLAYWAFLTTLLLVSNPAALVGLETVPGFPWGKFGIHLLAFAILGFLAHATRWPKPLYWPIIALLLAYGVATETLQLLVPHRTARVIDAVENILGIAIASGVYWLVQRLAAPVKDVNLAAVLVKWADEDADDG
jgi:VanZ family protein